MIATAAGRRTTGVHRPLFRTSRTRGSPRVFELRPMYLGTTGHQPQCMARGLPAHMSRRGSDRQPLHHQESTALPR
jgi:hypothetical protein